MPLDGLYISGYFADSDKAMLDQYAEELRSKSIPLYVRNLTGAMLQSAFDFTDFEMIAIGYEVLKQFVINGGYDITKCFIKKLWSDIAKGSNSNVPFTISIEGIPSENGAETIKCKIEGRLSDEEKARIIDKTLELASQVEKHQYRLMKKHKYFDALNGHIFNYDVESGELCEVDIEQELKKKSEKK